MSALYEKSPDAVTRTCVSVAASQTDSAIVAAVSGVCQRVIAVVVAGPTATLVKLTTKPAGAGTEILGLTYGTSTTTYLAQNDQGWCQTNAGEGLSVTTGSGGTTEVTVVSVAVKATPA